MASPARKSGKRGRPSLNKNRVLVQMQLDATLMAAFDQLARDNSRTRTAEVAIALREHLEREKRWPPKSPATDKDAE